MKHSLYFMLGLSLIIGTIAAYAQFGGSPEEEVAKQKQQILETSGILPGELFAFEGEELFYLARGPNNVSMEACDFGLGVGVVDGAYAQMPRYFEDTGKVEDIDSRVRTCMMATQGIVKDDVKRSEVVSLSTFIAMRSQGFNQEVSLEHPTAQAMYDIGEALWYSRAGGLDMSCAICHEVNANKRIRLQGLGDVKGQAMASHWPAFRFSNDSMWTMEDRLRGCYNNVSVKPPSHYSDPLIALQMYMSYQANGAPMEAPGFVR
ncbi:MAG: sulfur oxidation c-type cytochrome SoxA [Deinococcales bacterium]